MALRHAIVGMLLVLVFAGLTTPTGAPVVSQGRGTENPETLTALVNYTPPTVTPITPTRTPTTTRTPTITPRAQYLPFAVVAPPPNAPPTATPVPGAVRVLSSRTYIASTGSRYFIGEVQNQTSGVVFGVQIEVRYYNASNALVGLETAYSMLERLVPGQKSPFLTLTFNPPADIVRYETSVAWRSSAFGDYRPATVLSATASLTGAGNTRVVGEVRNDSGVPLAFVAIAATFYAGDGSVREVTQGYVTADTLAPGATSAYELLILGDVVSAPLVVQAEGRVP